MTGIADSAIAARPIAGEVIQQTAGAISVTPGGVEGASAVGSLTATAGAGATVTLVGLPASALLGSIEVGIVNVWPENLPRHPLGSGFSIAFATSPVARTAMESGRAQQRRQFRLTPYIVSASWLMTSPQLAEFRSWVEFNVGFGAGWFEIDLILDKECRSVSARFINERPPAYSQMAAGRWVVTAQLEIIDNPDDDFVFTEGWPEQLPCAPVIGSQQDTKPGVIRSNLPGLARQRKRYQQSLETVSVTWRMTGDQFYMFKAFVEARAQHGASFFNITLPLDDGMREVNARFLGQSEIIGSYSAGTKWNVSATLEFFNPPSTSPETQQIIDILGDDIYGIQDELTPRPTLQPFFENYENHF